MIYICKKVLFIFLVLRFKSRRKLSFLELNFRKIDFTNYKQVKLFIFKKNFYLNKNKNIHTFDFLNFSKKLGGKIGINLSKKVIFGWYRVYKNKIGFPWIED